MTAVLLLFVFMGVFAGYAAARLYKSFKVCQTWVMSSLEGERHVIHTSLAEELDQRVNCTRRQTCTLHLMICFAEISP